MRRGTAIPLVFTAALGSVTAAGLLWMMASLEFSQWEHRGRLHLLPALAQTFHGLYRFGWSLPLAAMAAGALILARRERDDRIVSCYFGITAALTILWSAFGVLALNLMHASTAHQL
jgi:hypothetical protein